MKQENNENRPSFGLMKLNNIISYYHMQKIGRAHV